MEKISNYNDLSNKELIELRNKTEKIKWDHYNKFNKLTYQIKYLESVIFKKCDHEWELDYSASGPYDGPDKICKKCRLYNNNYMYQIH
jgi:hypothetical protein